MTSNQQVALSLLFWTYARQLYSIRTPPNYKRTRLIIHCFYRKLGGKTKRGWELQCRYACSRLVRWTCVWNATTAMHNARVIRKKRKAKHMHNGISSLLTDGASWWHNNGVGESYTQHTENESRGVEQRDRKKKEIRMKIRNEWGGIGFSSHDVWGGVGAQSPKGGENAWPSGDKAPSGNVEGGGGEGNKYQRRHRLNDLSVADGTTVTHSDRFTCMLGPHAI